MNPLRKSISAIEGFFLQMGSPVPLAALRIAIGLHALIQTLLLGPWLLDFYGNYGHVQWVLVDLLTTEGVPRMSALAAFLSQWGINEDGTVYLCYAAYIVSLVSLIIGWNTRVAAIFVWLLHFLFVKTSLLTAYGLETFTHVMMFLFILFPVGQAWSLDSLLGGRTKPALKKNLHAGLSIRYLQVLLAMAYGTSGIAKGLGQQWWNGDAIFITLIQPEFQRYDFSWMAQLPLIPMMICWGTVLLETSYPFLIWSLRTRWHVLAGICSMHVGIAIAMQLWSFSALMCILNLGIFAAPVWYEAWERRQAREQIPTTAQAAPSPT